jgi:WD40 repeat protein
MALWADPEESTSLEETEATASTEAAGAPDTSTLLPAAPSPGEVATIALAGGAAGHEDADEDDDRPQGANLIRPRELSPEYARRVTAVWRQTRSQFTNPKETIKTEKSGVFELGDLNIGSRNVGRVGDTGLKDYELSEVIGEGAMGTVWSARQASLDRDVAIKMPKGAATRTEMGRRQFMSEVVVTGQLDHPNIVPIYDLGKDSAGQLFYSMKRVDGRPWNELQEQEELTQQENLEILMKVCDAVRFAHDRGVIHRDIKPHNVMVGRYGEVSVMDWGIALRLDFDAPHASLARMSPAGTPAYMAPEMATGSAAEIGPPTDVYLLGAVLYEILTHEPPHPPPTDSDDHNEVLTDALLIAARNEIKPIAGGGELMDIAYRAMATDVANRYQNVREFQEAIRAYLSHAESINLTQRGVALLQRARATGPAAHGQHGERFDEFDRARFAFEEALAIWPGNRAARTHHEETLLAYANYAYAEGAYARGIALLSGDNPAHKDLLRKLKAARRRTNSLSLLLKAAVLLILVGGSVFTYFLYRAREVAENERFAAETSRNQAVNAQQKAELARNEAIQAKNAETDAKDAAIAAQLKEQDAKDAAIAAQLKEQEAKERALQSQRDEEVAKNRALAAQKEAQRSSYAFEIGLAAEELHRNAFDRAAEILTSQAKSEAKQNLRNWEWGYLNSLVSLDSKTFDVDGKLLQSRVEATAISKNREWVAAGTSGGDLYVWRFDRSEQPVRLQYGRAVHAVAIAADGSTVLAGGTADGGAHTISKWTLPARDGAAPDGQLGSHAKPILSLDVSPDSSVVLSSAADGTVGLARLDGTASPRNFVATSQENSVWSARFSPDGQWFVTAGEDGTVRVWPAAPRDVAQGPVTEIRRFEEHEGPVYTAAFAPDGSYVVSGGRDRQLLAMPLDANRVGDDDSTQIDTVRRRLTTVSETPRRGQAVLVGEHDASIRSIAFAHEAPILFSAGNDHTVRVWDLAHGPQEARALKTLRGHGGWVRSCVAIPGESDSVLTGSYDRRVRIWNWRTYAFPLVLRTESRRSLGDPELTAGAASPDGQWVAAASRDGLITAWDMSDPLQPKTQELAEGHDWQTTTAEYFPDRRRLLTAGGDNTALIWDAQRGNELVRIGGWNETIGAGWRGVATVSSDGRWVATGAEQGVLTRLWDARNGDPIAALSAPTGGTWPEGEAPQATALAFSPDSDVLAQGDQWGTCYLASATENWQSRSFQAHDAKITAIKFLSGDQGFLTASSDGTVLEWDRSTDGRRPRVTYRHADRVIAMDLSADGRFLITAAGSGDEQAVVRIWDRTQPTAPLRTLRLADLGGDDSLATNERLMVRSVALHSDEPQALITVYDPPTSTYRVGRWKWNATSSPFRLVSNAAMRDLSTALFAPEPSDAMLTVGGRGARLKSLDSPDGRVAMTYRPQAQIGSLSFSADGALLLSASKDGSVKIWRLKAPEREWVPEAKLVDQHDAAINSVAFHPSRSDLFLTASDDGTAKLWSSRDGTWKVLRVLTAPGGRAGAVHDAQFITRGDDEITLVTAGVDGTFLWEDGSERPRAVGTSGLICCAKGSPDGKWIVVASGSSLTIYDATTLDPVGAPLTGHSAEVTSVAFTPDGSRMFTASRDYTVKLWDAQTMLTQANGSTQQRELLTLEGHSDEVTSLTVVARKVHPFVLTTGRDGQAIIWPSQPVTTKAQD